MKLRTQVVAAMVGLVAAAWLTGCADKQNVTLEISRETIITEPTIGSLVTEPGGTLDTRESDQVVKVTLRGDSGLRASYDVPGLVSDQPMQEHSAGIYEGSFQVPQGRTGPLEIVGRLVHEPSQATATRREAGALRLIRTERTCDARLAGELDALLQGTSVTFELGKAVLSESAKQALAQKSGVLTDDRFFPCSIHVHGHADAQGDADFNDHLSRLRAHEVGWYLKSLGVPAGRLETHFHGETVPATSANTPDAYSRNRRVELRAIHD